MPAAPVWTHEPYSESSTMLTSIPEGVLLTSAEEQAELEAVLGGAGPATPAAADALASDLLRKMAECDAETRRFKDAYMRESVRLSDRYAGLLEPIEARRNLLENAVLALAERTDFGKAKSRNVGFGTYGRRRRPDRIVIVDADKVLAWAREHGPLLIERKECVPHRFVVERFKVTGELADGCEFHAEHVEPFATPITEGAD